jgi:hypothetical protein
MAQSPITVSNRALLKLNQGLGSLDGINSKEGVIPFVFDTETKLALLHNAIVVERAKEALDRFDRDSVKANKIWDGMEKTPESVARLNAHITAREEMLDGSTDLTGLRTLKIERLLNQPCEYKDKPGEKSSAKTNHIPQSVLVMLAPIFEDCA